MWVGIILAPLGCALVVNDAFWPFGIVLSWIGIFFFLPRPDKIHLPYLVVAGSIYAIPVILKTAIAFPDIGLALLVAVILAHFCYIRRF